MAQYGTFNNNISDPRFLYKSKSCNFSSSINEPLLEIPDIQFRSLKRVKRREITKLFDLFLNMSSAEVSILVQILKHYEPELYSPDDIELDIKIENLKSTTRKKILSIFNDHS